MADMTGTTMATYLPEVWSRLATITYRSNVVIWPLFDHRWEPELGVGMGDTVNIPGFSQNTGATKESTFGTGATITFDAVTEAQIQLVVDTLAYKAYRMPYSMTVQAMSVYQPLLTKGIGEAVALQVDTDSATAIRAFDTEVGSDNIDITDDDILTCETNLHNQNAPMQDRFLTVSPASRGSMMKIDVIRNQLYAKSVGNLVGSRGAGVLGEVYSFTAIMSNNLTAGTAGKENGAFQREAVAAVMQKGLTMLNDVNIEDGPFRQVWGGAVYGLKEIKDAFGNQLNGK